MLESEKHSIHNLIKSGPDASAVSTTSHHRSMKFDITLFLNVPLTHCMPYFMSEPFENSACRPFCCTAAMNCSGYCDLNQALMLLVHLPLLIWSGRKLIALMRKNGWWQLQLWITLFYLVRSIGAAGALLLPSIWYTAPMRWIVLHAWAVGITFLMVNEAQSRDQETTGYLGRGYWAEVWVAIKKRGFKKAVHSPCSFLFALCFFLFLRTSFSLHTWRS